MSAPATKSIKAAPTACFADATLGGTRKNSAS